MRPIGCDLSVDKKQRRSPKDQGGISSHLWVDGGSLSTMKKNIIIYNHYHPLPLVNHWLNVPQCRWCLFWVEATTAAVVWSTWKYGDPEHPVGGDAMSTAWHHDIHRLITTTFPCWRLLFYVNLHGLFKNGLYTMVHPIFGELQISSKIKYL